MKKIVATILVLTMVMTLLACSSVTGFAAEESSTKTSNVTVSLDSVTGKTGATVVVPLRIKGVPAEGIGAFNFKLQYDPKVFEVVSLTPGNIIPNANTNFDKNIRTQLADKHEVVLLFLDNTGIGTDSIKKNGVLANIKVKIKDKTLNGKFRFDFDTTNSSIANIQAKELNTKFVNGSVVSNPMGIETSKVNGKAGANVTLPVKLTNVPKQGVGEVSFKLNYDAKSFDVVKVIPGAAISASKNNLTYKVDKKNGVITITYASKKGAAVKPITKNGKLVDVQLKAKKGVKGTKNIKITQVGKVTDKDKKELVTTISGGSIIIK